MKHLIALLLIAGTWSSVMAAQPVAMVQKSRLAYTPVQFREGLSDRDFCLIDVNLRLDYPVAIAGVSQASVEKLRRRLLEKALLLSEKATGERAPALLEPLLKTIEEKQRMTRDDGFCMASLDYEERLSVTCANASYAAVYHEGVYNEGGNGCHRFSESEILRMDSMKPIAFGELVTDGAGYARLLADELLRSASAEDQRAMKDLKDGGVDFVLKNTLDTPPRMIPTVRGMRFVYPPYALLAGCMGMPTAVIPWVKLRPVCNRELLAELEALAKEP